MSNDDFNARNIEEFRASHGKLGGNFEGAPVLLLHSVGAKSGEERVSPMMYMADGDRILVFASAAGANRNPAWYWNLVAHPDVSIEVGDELLDVRAIELVGAERDAMYAEQARRYPGFGDYQRKTARIIPVLALLPKAKMAEAILGELLVGLPAVTHQSGDDAYTTATDPDNSSFPQRPAAVVRARTADDVARAVAIAARAGGRIVVQATGHGASAPIGPDTVLLDTSALDGVFVDAAARTARVGAGAMWPAVQAAAAPHGLLGLSGTSPTVGVVGYTFSGGVSWLVRKFGMAAAALRSVDYVDGTGRIRRAADDAPEPLDREALWAFRGGAPVGIATAIEVGLVEVPELWTGYLLWPVASMPAVVAAWAAATAAVSPSVTSSMSLLHLPPKGPFPDDLLGTTVVHLSYASPDGGAHLEPMRDAVRTAAAPVVDTTGPGDIESLAQIHLDPPAAVPARGTGRWLNAAAADLIVSIFDAARVGQPQGLNMIELRHTDSRAAGPAGAMTTVPAPFLLHAVGIGADDAARNRTDDVLRDVEDASRGADVGRSAPAFREGQPDAADAMPIADLDRLRAVRDALDPDRVLAFSRHPVS